ncbi:hypothetical protein ACTMTJ_20325 [Phytohabitans sp. LJ34]|uniref:hypothetical protein n=1 Tax=Phytohabitans sp. LJ34 TaxID=3452217 RepID=UPI003F88F422
MYPPRAASTATCLSFPEEYGVRERADTAIATVPGAAHNAVTTAGGQVAALTDRFLASN